jgi:hypothetical protein
MSESQSCPTCGAPADLDVIVAELRGAERDLARFLPPTHPIRAAVKRAIQRLK